jgi:putative nucleotidyltransferase with HDIG domain
MVRSIAIGVASFDALTRRVERVLDLEAFWKHSVAVGVVSKDVAARAGIGPPGTAFCAGILHDVGKLALAIVSLPGMRRAAERFEIARTTDDVRAIEREELGVDHEAAGLELGRRWKFPPELLAAVAHHHEPWTQPEDEPWGALTHVGDWTARRLGFHSVPKSPAACPDAPDTRALARLALGARALDEVVEVAAMEIPPKVEKFCESFHS